LCAEDWGIPPWEVWNGDAVWFQRWKYMKVQMEKKNSSDAKVKGK
jgi:hypothetical protein